MQRLEGPENQILVLQSLACLTDLLKWQAPTLFIFLRFSVFHFFSLPSIIQLFFLSLSRFVPSFSPLPFSFSIRYRHISTTVSMASTMGAQTFKKHRNHLTILGARRVACTVGSRFATVRFTTIHFYDPCRVGPSLWCITVATQASFLYLVRF